jgi:SNF2 family DNA or RNA helicase
MEWTWSKVFTRLQQVHEDHEDACTQYDEICRITETHPTFQEIKEHYIGLKRKKPERDTWNELKRIKSTWGTEIDSLAEEESELYKKMSDAGYDIRAFYAERYIKPDVLRAQSDHVAMKARQTADAYLAKVNPVQVKDGKYASSLKAIGARGYKEQITDEHEAAECVWLDDGELLENDLPADRVTRYSDANDALGIDYATEVVDTGADWYKGFRISSSIQKILHEHQYDCMLFILDNLRRNRGTIVAHAMGMGKTLSVLVSLQVYSTKNKDMRAIVTCPKGMVQPWAEEIDNWRPTVDLDCFAIQSSDNICRDMRLWQRHGGVLVIGHDMYRRWLTDDLMPKDTDAEDTIVVVDEAHLLLKTATTKMYKAIDAMKTKRRILMTGTAMQNNMREYYTMINLCAPGLLGSSVADFNKMYAFPIENGMTKDSSKAERSRSEQLVWMLRKQCDVVMHSCSAELLHKTLHPKVEFCLLQGMDVDEDEDEDEDEEEGILQARHQVAANCRYAKSSLVVHLIDSIRKRCPQDNIVVFSPYTETLKQLAELRTGSIYIGDTGAAKRAEFKEEFDDVAGSILYVATKAGGVGINLTSGNRVIVVDASWNPADDNQAVARCYRMGQTKPVYVYRLIADCTLEGRLYDRQVQKHAMAASILDAKDIHRMYDKEDLKALNDKRSSLIMNFMSDAEVGAVDPCLVDARTSYEAEDQHEDLTITDHTKQFASKTTELSICEQEKVKNEMALALRETARHLIAPDDNLQIVNSSMLFFQEPFQDVLVQPYVPVIEKVQPGWLEKLKTVTSSLSVPVNKENDKKFSSSVTYVSSDVIFLRLGPYCRQDPDESTNFHFEVRICQTKSATGGDIPPDEMFWTHETYDAHSSIDERVLMQDLKPGSYVCSVRIVNTAAEDECSEWSEDSAEFTIV